MWITYLVKSLLFDSANQEREVAEDLHDSNADRNVDSDDSYILLVDLEAGFGFGSSRTQNLPTAAADDPSDPESVLNCLSSSARVACHDPGEPKDETVELSRLEEMADLKERTLRSNKTADATEGKALSLSDWLPLAWTASALLTKLLEP